MADSQSAMLLSLSPVVANPSKFAAVIRLPQSQLSILKYRLPQNQLERPFLERELHFDCFNLKLEVDSFHDDIDFIKRGVEVPGVAMDHYAFASAPRADHLEIFQRNVAIVRSRIYHALKPDCSSEVGRILGPSANMYRDTRVSDRAISCHSSMLVEPNNRR
ncbi:hypothetical protein [Mesorhizobium amorphae]|uniref:hypothetical protein n=1 Tax=Mesorhizobium amorphae TaxID=71433 RepID=UPI0011842A6C|nr:hypothetical protein [Mesorhizobium amorphae]